MTAKGMFAVLEPSDITSVVMSREFSETCDFFSGCLARVSKHSTPCLLSEIASPLCAYLSRELGTHWHFAVGCLAQLCLAQSWTICAGTCTTPHPCGIMLALTFSEKEGLRLKRNHAKPVPGHEEALVKVIRAGICSTVSSSRFMSIPCMLMHLAWAVWHYTQLHGAHLSVAQT